MSKKHHLPDAILFQWHETLATSTKMENMQAKQNHAPTSKEHLFAQRQIVSFCETATTLQLRRK